MLKVNIINDSDGCPETMYISWLEYQPFMKLDMEEQLFHVLDQVKASHIKNIIFDPSLRQQTPSDEHFYAFFELFLSGLADTQLEKFARIGLHHPATEARFQRFLREIKENIKVTFELKNFIDPVEANKWLCPEVQNARNKNEL